MGLAELRALDAQKKLNEDKLVAAEKDQPKMSDLLAQQKLIQDRIEQLERTEGGSGLIPLTPKQRLLDAQETKDKPENKGFHLRWVNTKLEEKMQARVAMGYERVPVAEGGRQVGNLVLFRLPQHVADARVEELRKVNLRRLDSHKAEVERAAESVARQLRDSHGIQVDARRILISEG